MYSLMVYAQQHINVFDLPVLRSAHRIWPLGRCGTAAQLPWLVANAAHKYDTTYCKIQHQQ
jgi:hypothetical protein